MPDANVPWLEARLSLGAVPSYLTLEGSGFVYLPATFCLRDQKVDDNQPGRFSPAAVDSHFTTTYQGNTLLGWCG